MRHRRFAIALLLLSGLLAGLRCRSRRGSGARCSCPHIDVHPVIVTATDVTTEPELATRGERALMEQRWRDAVRTRTARCSRPIRRTPTPRTTRSTLGSRSEGMQDRVKARDTFLDLAGAFPRARRRARPSCAPPASMPYLEDWTALAAIGDAMLSRGDLEDVDRIVALGSRGLARVRAGRGHRRLQGHLSTAWSCPIQLHYGARDVLPVAVAQLRFALGELRRVRSEKYVFDPSQPDFLDKFVERLELRCGGLLDAQEAYAMAVRSIDPHWRRCPGTASARCTASSTRT